MVKRKHKSRFDCVYCGISTATFCGYWKLVSVAHYNPNVKRDKSVIIDSCYAHISCYLERHHNLLLSCVTPLCVDNVVYNRPKQIVELMKMHNVKPQRLKNKIRFLEKVLKEYSKGGVL